MSGRDEEEARAEAWLLAQGYAPSRPTWLPRGRNPDFWAESATLDPPHLWAEVKSIDPDDSTAALSRFRSIIASVKIPPGLRGHGIVNIEPRAIEQSVRWVLKAFAQHAPKFADQKVVLAFVQQSRDGRDVRRAQIDASVPEMLWFRGAGNGQMHLPIGVCKESFAPAKVLEPGGAERTGKTFQFFEWRGDTECSLVAHLDPIGRPFGGLTSMSGGPGQTRERVVRALEDANAQIKTACVTREAPGIVTLVPRGQFVDDMTIAAAAYGHRRRRRLPSKQEHASHGGRTHSSERACDVLPEPIRATTHPRSRTYLRRCGARKRRVWVTLGGAWMCWVTTFGLTQPTPTRQGTAICPTD
jgi:hypothetical protein